MEAVVRAVLIRGPVARVELERTDNHELVEAQISRTRLDTLALHEGDQVFIETLKPQSVAADYAI